MSATPCKPTRSAIRRPCHAGSHLVPRTEFVGRDGIVTAVYSPEQLRDIHTERNHSATTPAERALLSDALVLDDYRRLDHLLANPHTIDRASPATSSTGSANDSTPIETRYAPNTGTGTLPRHPANTPTPAGYVTSQTGADPQNLNTNPHPPRSCQRSVGHDVKARLSVGDGVLAGHP